MLLAALAWLPGARTCAAAQPRAERHAADILAHLVRRGFPVRLRRRGWRLVAAGAAGGIIVSVLVLWLGEPSREALDLIVFAFRALFVVAIILEVRRRFARGGD